MVGRRAAASPLPQPPDILSKLSVPLVHSPLPPLSAPSRVISLPRGLLHRTRHFEPPYAWFALRPGKHGALQACRLQHARSTGLVIKRGFLTLPGYDPVLSPQTADTAADMCRLRGDKAVEGLAGGLHPAYGVRVSGSRIKRGRRIVLGSHGISYGNGVHGGTDRRDYGHVQTYGDRETFGFVRNPGANRRYGQGSFVNAYNNQAHAGGGDRYGVKYQGGSIG
ncbi:hypothetical protein MTO96_004551 [Rhipicephalus appendiculatus]